MATDTTQRSTGRSVSSSPARLQEAASDIADSAGQAAQTQASAAMQRAGETLELVASAVRDTGNQLRSDQPQIAGVADTAAQRIDQLAQYVRERDGRDLIDDAEQFARRQPAILIGGGLALGLIVGRLLRSGAEPSENGNGWHSRTAGSARWTGNGGTASRTGRMGSANAGSASIARAGYGTSYGTDSGADEWTSDPPQSASGRSAGRRRVPTSMPGSIDMTSDTEG